VQGEQHRKPGPLEAAGMQKPGQEAPSLADVPKAEEGSYADAGVAGPGEAVVSVADPAQVLGERLGGCGDRGARW